MNAGDRNSPKRPTIYDLAAVAGTSASAVSSVLNGSWKKRRISAQLAERITRIAERFEALARQRGLFPVITCTQRDPKLEVEAANELLAYQVDCLVCTGATDPDRISDLCAAAGVRTINLDLPGSRAVSVISDNYEGARALARLILDRRGAEGPLLFVGGRATDHNTDARIRGFLDAHRERGIAVPGENVLACGYAAEKAETALAQFAGARPGGIFVNSTITLEGVVRWVNGLEPARRQGIRYGCFDWDPFGALLPENVGMVQQDISSMLDTVFALLEAPPENPAPVLVPCIVRAL